MRRAGRAARARDRRARRATRCTSSRSTATGGRRHLPCWSPTRERVQFGRLAVDAATRAAPGSAIALLGEADRRARALGAQRIVLTAQTYARGALRARPATPREATSFLEAGIEHVDDGEARLPEVRVDPLTGLRTIVAGDRAGAPRRRAVDAPPPDADRPGAATRSSRATRTARRPRSTRCAPDGGAPDTPGWTRPRRAEPLPGARAPTPPDAGARRDARPVHRHAGARRRTRWSSTRRSRSTSLAELTAEQVAAAVGRLARAHPRRTPAARLRARARQRAPRGRRVAAAHARAALRARLRARRRSRASASASARTPTRTMGGNLLGDLVQEEVAPARADRRDRRRGGAARARTPRGCPTSCMLAPRRAARALRGRRPAGAALLHDALQPPRAPLRRRPAAEPLGPHRAARRRPLLLADRRPARA